MGERWKVCRKCGHSIYHNGTGLNCGDSKCNYPNYQSFVPICTEERPCIPCYTGEGSCMKEKEV